MSCQRDEVLKQFLENNEFIEMAGISEEQKDNVSFVDKNENIVLEALKKIIMAYCNDESDVSILRKANTVLSKEL